MIDKLTFGQEGNGEIGGIFLRGRERAGLLGKYLNEKHN